jgi:hypothetical protein
VGTKDTNSNGGVWIENVGIQFSLESSEESYAILVYHCFISLFEPSWCSIFGALGAQQNGDSLGDLAIWRLHSLPAKL